MSVPREEIEKQAHKLWLQYGKPNGRDLELWLKAETFVKNVHLSKLESELYYTLVEELRAEKAKDYKGWATVGRKVPIYEWDYIYFFTEKRNDIRRQLGLPLIELGPKYIDWLASKKKEELEGNLLSHEQWLNTQYMKALNS